MITYDIEPYCCICKALNSNIKNNSSCENCMYLHCCFKNNFQTFYARDNITFLKLKEAKLFIQTSNFSLNINTDLLGSFNCKIIDTVSVSECYKLLIYFKNKYKDANYLNNQLMNVDANNIELTFKNINEVTNYFNRIESLKSFK